MLIRDILKKKGSKTITTSKETKVVDIAHILAKEKIGAIVILEKDLPLCAHDDKKMIVQKIGKESNDSTV